MQLEQLITRKHGTIDQFMTNCTHTCRKRSVRRSTKTPINSSALSPKQTQALRKTQQHLLTVRGTSQTPLGRHQTDLALDQIALLLPSGLSKTPRRNPNQCSFCSPSSPLPPTDLRHHLHSKLPPNDLRPLIRTTSNKSSRHSSSSTTTTYLESSPEPDPVIFRKPIDRPPTPHPRVFKLPPTPSLLKNNDYRIWYKSTGPYPTTQPEWLSTGRSSCSDATGSCWRATPSPDNLVVRFQRLTL